MFTPYLDLHTHTILSDGALSPQQLIDKAYASGIRVLSITDHNTTSDLNELREYITSKFDEEMTLIQGAEISALYVDGNGTEHELHIVALGFDPHNPNMKALMASHQPDRRPYVDAILKRLKDDCSGIDIGTYESIQAQFPTTRYIGRMALARIMTDKGITSSVDEAFNIYLSSHGMRKAYVKNPLRYSSLEEVVRTIIQSGGIPVLAHLLYFDLDNGNRTGGEEKEQLVSTFKKLVDLYDGVGGMEVYYARYTDMDERLYLLKMAQKYGLLISGGSDYHEQESWETLDHRLSCSACTDLLGHLGIQVNYPLPLVPIHVISGYSGVGKGTIAEQLRNLKIDGKPVALIRSYTSRPPRSGKDPYIFVSQEQFAEMVKHNKFLEFNNSYAQYGYGTPFKDVRVAIENDNAILLEIDCTGLAHLLTDGNINPKLVRSVFIVADAADVATRLYLRGTETRQKIRTRLEASIEETEYLHFYDGVIVNNVVADAVEATIAIFEGKPPKSDFDPVRFKTEMKRIIDTFY